MRGSRDKGTNRHGPGELKTWGTRLEGSMSPFPSAYSSIMFPRTLCLVAFPPCSTAMSSGVRPVLRPVINQSWKAVVHLLARLPLLAPAGESGSAGPDDLLRPSPRMKHEVRRKK